MKSHDERPGAAGESGQEGAPSTARLRASDPAGSGEHRAAPESGGTQGMPVRSYSYYDEDAEYSEDTSPAGGRSGEEIFPRRPRLASNGGADLGLLLIRLALGAVFALHGSQKLFGVLGGPGTGGFAESLIQQGFREPLALALVTGGTELGAGALLVLGLFTPLAAAGIVGVMANAVLLNLSGGILGTPAELAAVCGAVALGLMFAGPGRAALDNGRSWYRHPLISGLIALLVAAGASVAVQTLFH